MMTLRNYKQIINFETWNKKNSFSHFLEYDYPFLTVTNNINITNAVRFSKKYHQSFYGIFSWIILNAANLTEAFRYRVENEHIVLYEKIGISFSVLKQDNSFNFSRFVEHADFQVFIKLFSEEKRIAEHYDDLEYKNYHNILYVTCLPWFELNSMVNPMRLKKTDFIPRISWGKYFERDGQYYLTVCVQVHHSLIDGYDLGVFFSNLNATVEELNNL